MVNKLILVVAIIILILSYYTYNNVKTNKKILKELYKIKASELGKKSIIDNINKIDSSF